MITKHGDFPAGLAYSPGGVLNQLSDAAFVARNGLWSTENGLTRFMGRPGWTVVNTFNPLRSIIRFPSSSGTNYTYLARDDNSTVAWNYSVGLSVGDSGFVGGGGFATGIRWYHAIWPQLNTVYVGNGFTSIRSMSNTTFATVTQTGVQMTGPYLAVYRGALWGTRGDTLSSEVYKSNVDDPTVVAAVNTLKVNDAGGGLITGLVANGDRLVIVKQNSLWAVHGDPSLLTTGSQASLIRIADFGSPAPDTIQHTPYGVVFLSFRGLFITNGDRNDALDISGPAKWLLFRSPTSQPGNTLPSAVGRYIPHLDAYWLTLDQNSTVSYLIQFVRTSSGLRTLWSEHIGIPFFNAVGFQMGDTDGTRVLTGSSSGTLNTAWLPSVSTDGGNAYTTTLTTHPQSMAEQFGMIGRMHEIRAVFRSASNVTFTVFYNGDQGSTDSVTFPVGSLSNVRTRGFLTNLALSGSLGQVQVTVGSANTDFVLDEFTVVTREHSRRYFR
jgi:hypothetical protein